MGVDTRAADRSAGPVLAGRFRGDIEGLRGLALALVLVGHAGVAALPAAFVAVDVFFVISGFLITGLLVDEIRRTGRVRIVDFYVRRAKRLLPAASVVLVASLLLTYLFLPPIRWSETARDALASAAYAMNWRLVEQSTDYLRSEEAPSILQHYWSLAVEEQFYLVWPLLLLAVARYVTRRTSARTGTRRPLPRSRPGRHRRPFLGDRTAPWLLAAFAVVGVPSLAWSIHLSQSEPARAYLVTTTRMWELALGGALAILSGHLTRLPRSAAITLGWAGMATVALAAMLIRPETAAYPGHLALLPTLGAVAIIAAGPSAGRHGPALLLNRRPTRAVGAVSYSWYLWHWPLLVVAEARWGPLGTTAGLAMILCSAVPAVLTYHLVENPFRYARISRARVLRMGLVATGMTVIAGIGLHLAVRPPPSPGPAELAGAVPGAPPGDGRTGAPVDRFARITPDPLGARDDLPDVYRDDCVTQAQDASLRSCTYGDRDSAVEVAVAGDSHAAHWVPALQAIATERGWRLVTYIKTTCSFLKAPITVAGRSDPSCTEWNSRLRRALTGERRPRLLIVSSVTQIPLVDGSTPPPGSATADAQTVALSETWSEVTAAGLPLVVIRDTPSFTVDMAECVSAHRERLTACAQPRERALAWGVPQERAAAAVPDARLADLNAVICPTERCPAVIGGLLVYRDAHHLTATYARSLAPQLHERLRQLVSPRLP
ncbi:Peptidoglycan/LPS O-acetylase OafA/YrhL, contains acyltransferase and SGNH-hydrolase domains [Micromonospora chokoriensis]|uniref:Peptidoglycan/LPS O-acetylase OafA/YrhL, contains acyltransferase and SGNH-hydrolase domains n=1 Tax=Micromonospora chokoriensis TaxID=356851 RepID=A0A1C4Z6U2_9ACTN|nr:Peptidoglycan/LPS O-acetylase OafA/YrhL, contains acyltransferase and SGNH-hydrolase domains [Micromonospora chokoriensis]